LNAAEIDRQRTALIVSRRCPGRNRRICRADREYPSIRRDAYPLVQNLTALSHQVAGLHGGDDGIRTARPMIENRSQKRKFVSNVRHIPQSRNLMALSHQVVGSLKS